jgi:chromosome partitioning protein
MIIAIANQCAGEHSQVGACLAALRTQRGRSVLLLDTDPRRDVDGAGIDAELERLEHNYNDIIVDTEGRDTVAGRAALRVARLVVVPVHVDEVSLERQYQLIARLNSTRMFNPGLRVVFVILGGAADPSSAELAAVRSYVGHVMSATLAGTVLHARTPAAFAADMDALYREVFAP